MCIDGHSCLCCSSYSTVFSAEEGTRKLCSKHAARYKAMKFHAWVDDMPVASTQAQSSDPSTELAFPPEPADASLTNMILSKACKKKIALIFGERVCRTCA